MKYIGYLQTIIERGFVYVYEFVLICRKAYSVVDNGISTLLKQIILSQNFDFEILCNRHSNMPIRYIVSEESISISNDKNVVYAY